MGYMFQLEALIVFVKKLYIFHYHSCDKHSKVTLEIFVILLVWNDVKYVFNISWSLI